MESSDSESFECAYEDFQQSDSKIPKQNKKPELLSSSNNDDENQTHKQLQNLKLVDENQEISPIIPSDEITEKNQSIVVCEQSLPLNEVPKQQNEQPEENLWDLEEIDWEKENSTQSSNDKKTNETQINSENKPNTSQNNDQKSEIENKNKKIAHPSSENVWGWNNWSVSSILTTATQGVSTLSSQMSQVLGAPDPEVLAKIDTITNSNPEAQQQTTINFGLNHFVSGVSQLTKLVETTSTKVITGGLDTLETIGKKTMEVLQEGDPGLKKKRAFLKIDQEKPILSQLLVEAKEKNEKENICSRNTVKKQKNFETLFDDHQGLVHLEALELLSKQCDIKLQNINGNCFDEELKDFQVTMNEIKQLCELVEDDENDDSINNNDIQEKIDYICKKLKFDTVYFKKLTDTWCDINKWLGDIKLEFFDETELHQQAIETLAQLTAIAMEQYHKIAELLMFSELRNADNEADGLVQLTLLLISLNSTIALKFSEKLTIKKSSCMDKETLNSFITNIFFEAGNSSSYIKSAFQLMKPILQVGALLLLNIVFGD